MLFFPFKIYIINLATVCCSLFFSFSLKSRIWRLKILSQNYWFSEPLTRLMMGSSMDFLVLSCYCNEGIWTQIVNYRSWCHKQKKKINLGCSSTSNKFTQNLTCTNRSKYQVSLTTRRYVVHAGMHPLVQVSWVSG